MGLWRSTLRARVKPLVYRFRSRLLYRLAASYVNFVDNENDSDMETNGEGAFARAQLPGARVAFDVGAAKAHWTKLALAADPHVVVHCFEPESARFQLLQSLALGDRVVLNKLGLGDAVSEAQIYTGASGGSNSLYPQRFNGESYTDTAVETIRITTIDAYCRDKQIDRVDFIKMDIEGYETSAIRGAEGMLRAGKIGIIQFEYSYVFLDAGSSLMRLMQYVREVNPAYEFYKIYPDGVRHVPAYRHALDNFKTQNWAIIKRTP